MGLKHPSIAPYGAFTGADGRDIVISIQNERECADFCRGVLKRPELLADERCAGNAARVRHRDFVDGVVAEVFGSQPSATVVDRLITAQTAFGNINSVYDLIEPAAAYARDAGGRPQHRHSGFSLVDGMGRGQLPASAPPR